jgi:hypothetical protein
MIFDAFTQRGSRASARPAASDSEELGIASSPSKGKRVEISDSSGATLRA